MFEAFDLAFKVWRLQRQRRHTQKYHAERFRDLEGISEEILHLKSDYLEERAQSIGIPIPPLSDSESWIHVEPYSIRLSLEAQLELKGAIRKEQREKLAFAAFMLKEIAAPLIGSVGAIMGLLSLIHSFKAK